MSVRHCDKGPNKRKAKKNGFQVFSKESFTYTRRKNAAKKTLREILRRFLGTISNQLYIH